jgi:adenylate cyclase
MAAGAALNARYLVEGATRIIADDHARIAARLVDANDGAELWSQDYDVDPAGIFDVEEDIALGRRQEATCREDP